MSNHAHFKVQKSVPFQTSGHFTEIKKKETFLEGEFQKKNSVKKIKFSLVLPWKNFLPGVYTLSLIRGCNGTLGHWDVESSKYHVISKMYNVRKPITYYHRL